MNITIEEILVREFEWEVECFDEKGLTFDSWKLEQDDRINFLLNLNERQLFDRLDFLRNLSRSLNPVPR